MNDLATRAACAMGDHGGLRGYCPDCGHINYRLLGYYGAVARWAKAWGVTQDEAEDRMVRHAIQQDIDSGHLSGAVEDYL